MQVTLVLAIWAAMVIWAPAFFLTVYAPAYAVGLAICWLHGYYEHESGATEVTPLSVAANAYRCVG